MKMSVTSRYPFVFEKKKTFGHLKTLLLKKEFCRKQQQRKEVVSACIFILCKSCDKMSVYLKVI